MTNMLVGSDALGALNAEAGGGNNNEYTSFKSGTTLTVKVLGTADIMAYDAYGIFKQVNSFVAENPSIKTPQGFPTDNLTPWDKAFLYHRNLSKEFNDEHGMEANKYRPRRRFAMGFYDLDTGEQIVIDVTKNQAQTIHGVIKQFEKRLPQMAFTLSKQGQSTNTTVSLTPVMFMDEDLTDVQRANFDKAPEEFDVSKFEGINFEMNEQEMIEKLDEVGFDVTLIGYDKPTADNVNGGDSNDDNEFGF